MYVQINEHVCYLLLIEFFFREPQSV